MSQDDLLVKVDTLLGRHGKDALASPGMDISAEIPTLTETINPPPEPSNLASSASEEISAQPLPDDIPVLTEIVFFQPEQNKMTNETQDLTLAEILGAAEHLEKHLTDQLVEKFHDRVSEHAKQLRADIEHWVHDAVKNEVETQIQKALLLSKPHKTANTSDPNDQVN